MWRVTLRGIRARPVRFALSCLAVVLGVSFVVGSLTLTATIQRGFDDLFADLSAGTDLQVRQQSDLARQGQIFRGRIDQALLDRIRAIPGVDVAVPRIQGVAYLVGADGKVTGGSADAGPQPIAASWPFDPRTTPFRLVEGRDPQHRDEVVIDRKTARAGKLTVGSVTRVLTKLAPRSMTVVGIVRFGRSDSPGGAPVLLFSPGQAAELLGEPGRLDSIDIIVKSAATKQTVQVAIARVLPPKVEVVGSEIVTKERQGGPKQQLQFLSAFLLLFAGLSVVVGSFVIANTFAITVSQRTRELALLRALGASRRQVGGIVFGEALAVGLVASVVGVGVGVLIAIGLRAGLSSLGVVVPPGPTVIRALTIAVGLVLGVLTTLAAAAVPAWHATRLAPLRALRDATTERRASKLRTGGGVALLALATYLIVRGARLPSLSQAGLGAVVLLIGAVFVGPTLSGALGSIVSAPLPRLFGVTGQLARQNAARNPRRTSSSALSLTMAASVGAFAVVMGASFSASLRTAVTGGVRGDFVVRGGAFGIGGFSPTLATDIAKLPEVEAASGIRYGFAEVIGPKRKPRVRAVVQRSGARPIAAFDPAVADRLLDVGLISGRLSDLGPGRIGLSKKELDEKGWKIGDRLTLNFAEKSTIVTIAVTFRQSLAFDYAMSISAIEPLMNDDFDFGIYVAKKPGVDTLAAKAAIENVTKTNPLAKVLNQEEFAAGLTSSVDQLLSLITALLGLAVVIVVLGIGITLTLTVHERTRELGLLRAVGMGRSQARVMVRLEAIVIAVFGSLVGVAAGTVTGWSLTRALRSEGLGQLRVPFGGIAVLFGGAAIAGVIAAVVPARRAASVSVLDAFAQQ
jgi:putative ABC transport system permease protein